MHPAFFQIYWYLHYVILKCRLLCISVAEPESQHFLGAGSVIFVWVLRVPVDKQISVCNYPEKIFLRENKFGKTDLVWH
jgi:hypothetical protein